MLKITSMRTLFVSICIASASSSLMANSNKQLIVVTDRSSNSALKYYQSLNIQNNSRPIKKIPALNIKPVTEASMLPIISERLSPGRVDAKVINANGLVRPFFIVGADPLSIKWLTERVNILKQLNAVGLVVNVNTQQEFQTIKQIAPTLTILPISGDDIADRLSLEHYPVLVTATSIEQ